MLRVDVTRQAAALLADRRRHADDFAHHAAHLHVPDRAERLVRDADVAEVGALGPEGGVERLAVDLELEASERAGERECRMHDPILRPRDRRCNVPG